MPSPEINEQIIAIKNATEKAIQSQESATKFLTDEGLMFIFEQFYPEQLSECYKPLFDLMYNEHGILLLESELDEIIIAAKKVEENYNELMKEPENFK